MSQSARPLLGPVTGRLLSRCKLDGGSGTVVKGSIGNESDEVLMSGWF